MTNWDKMKEMDIYEVAKIINGCPEHEECIDDCAKCWEKWLNTDITLKPCPFCGKRVAKVTRLDELVHVKDFVHPDYYHVICGYNYGGCGSMLGGEYETEEEAIEKWNTRFGEE